MFQLPSAKGNIFHTVFRILHWRSSDGNKGGVKSRPQTPLSHEEKRSGEPSQILGLAGALATV